MKKLSLLFFVLALFSGMNAFAQVPAYAPTNNLLGWWQFTGNQNDLTGNLHHGINGGATAVADRNNAANTAYHFSNAYTTLPSLPFNTNEDWSISFWMKLNTAQNYNVIMEINANSQCSGAPQVWQNNGSVYLAYCGTSAGAIFMDSASHLLGQWRHFVLVQQSDSTSIYRDGNLVSKTSSFWPVTSSINITLANDASLVSMHNNPSQVDMDDVGVWNRALATCEISQLYNSAALAVTQQPADQNVIPGASAQFTVASSIPGVTYLWQTDFGIGFQPLFNAGQYSGVTTNTLTVSNITSFNHNQIFRCLINNTSSCQANSSTAKITVQPGTGINTAVIPAKFSLYPNPTGNDLTLSTSPSVLGETYTITDAAGKEIWSGKITGTTINIPTQSLAAGLYFMRISNGGAVQKFVKQ